MGRKEEIAQDKEGNEIGEKTDSEGEGKKMGQKWRKMKREGEKQRQQAWGKLMENGNKKGKEKEQAVR